MTRRPETTSRDVNGKRLWAGADATAAVVGILATQGLAHVSMLARTSAGSWDNADTAGYGRRRVRPTRPSAGCAYRGVHAQGGHVLALNHRAVHAVPPTRISSARQTVW
jgi:hypothetical protein